MTILHVNFGVKQFTLKSAYICTTLHNLGSLSQLQMSTIGEKNQKEDELKYTYCCVPPLQLSP